MDSEPVVTSTVNEIDVKGSINVSHGDTVVSDLINKLNLDLNDSINEDKKTSLVVDDVTASTISIQDDQLPPNLAFNDFETPELEFDDIEIGLAGDTGYIYIYLICEK